MSGLFDEVNRILRPKRAQIKRLKLQNARLKGSVEKSRTKLEKFRTKLETANNRPFVEPICRGASLEEAIVDAVREMHARNLGPDMRAFTQSLVDKPDTREIGAVAMGVALSLTQFPEAALGYFRSVPEAMCLSLCPQEYTDAVMASTEDDRLSQVEAKARNFLEQGVFSGALACVRSLMKYAFNAEAISLARAFPEGAANQMLEDEVLELGWILSIADARSDPAGPEDCDVLFGLMDYKLLARDRSSSNLGDYVQTMAALGNIARHDAVEFVTEEDGLGATLKQFQDRIADSDRIKGDGPVKVGIIPVDRDYSSGRRYRKPTWMISNGWFMHANGRGVFDFPYDPDIRPIFVSFHINHDTLLTPEAISYLKAHAPIGCRDWTSVYRLMDFGVDAFFSGCLTTSVGLVYGHPAQDGTGQIANVEAALTPQEKSDPRVVAFEQVFDNVRDYGMATGLEEADRFLEGYRKFDKIITSRLHCYLPCRSMGLEVDFRPRNSSDIRFDGLEPLDREAYDAIRFGLQDKLASLLPMIFSGAAENEIWDHWRALCAKDVEVARARLKSAPSLPATNLDHVEIVAKARAGMRVHGPQANIGAKQIAFCVDANLLEALKVAIHSTITNTRGRLCINVVVRDISEDICAALAAYWPDTCFRFFDLSDVEYDDLFLLSHTTVATMDRLFLPELLPDAQTIVYLDVDLILRGDISELLEFDVSEVLVAGRSSNSHDWRTGIGLLNLKAKKQDGPTARRMRLWAYGNGKVHFRTFNAGVLVLNAQKLRERDFTKKTLAMTSAFGFHDQDAINFFVRTECAPLNMEWNYIPSQNFCEGPKLVHWAGPIKPWDKKYTLYRNEYLAALVEIET